MLALILPEVNTAPAFTTASLTEKSVDELNGRIVKASHRQIFGNSAAALAPYL